MASLGGQTVASSFDRLLILPSGGGDGANLISLTDGNEGTTFALKLSTGGISIDGGDKLYLDGGDSTYITESSNGVMDFYADGEILLRLAKDDAGAVFMNKFHIVDENIGTTDESRMTFQTALSTSGTSVVHSIQIGGDNWGGDIL